MLLVVVWWCQICSTNFPKFFFHAFDDYIKNIDILKIHHLKKNFYSIVQLQPIRNIFSLRPIIKSRNFFRFKIVKVTIFFWKIYRSRYFRQRSVLLLDSFSWGIGEGQNCQVERDRMGMSRFRMRPRVWADSSDANARNWWTPWYVCASPIMSLASENRSENISRDKLLFPLPTTISPPIETFAISNALGIRCDASTRSII